jgi:hypothetical protein
MMDPGQALRFEKPVRIHCQTAKAQVKQLKGMIERIKRRHTSGGRIDLLLYEHGVLPD